MHWRRLLTVIFLSNVILFLRETTIGQFRARPAACPVFVKQLFPCNCTQSTLAGLDIECINVSKRLVALALRRQRQDDDVQQERVLMPIAKLTLSNSLIRRWDSTLLTGTLVEYIQNLQIDHAGMNSIDVDALPLLLKSKLKSLSLRHNNLTTIPRQLLDGMRQLEHLDLSHNAFIAFNSNQFSPLVQLKSTLLSSNQLSNLSPTAFDGLEQLQFIDLSHNAFNHIPENVTQLKNSLTVFNISHNSIDGRVSRKSFVNFTALRVLDLRSNKIIGFDMNAFWPMRQLQMLHLDDNRIATVFESQWNSNFLLRNLTISKNKLTSMSGRTLQWLMFLQHLDLSQNNLRRLSAHWLANHTNLLHVNVSHNPHLRLLGEDSFSEIVNISVIDLSYCALEHIEVGAFGELVSLNALLLHHNNLQTIPKQGFKFLPFLRELDLSYNNISSIRSVIGIVDLISLQNLNLSHNNVNQIKTSDLPKMYVLNSLDLSYNNLSTLSGGALASLPALWYLDLSNNFLGRDKTTKRFSMGMFRPLLALLELRIANNSINDIGKYGLQSLGALQRVDFSYNNLSTFFHLPVTLQQLSVAHNILGELKKSYFPRGGSLRSLDISYNLLTTLPKNTFDNVFGLNLLNLRANRLSRVPECTISTLQYLDLGYNSITRIENDTFAGTARLRELQLDNNEIHELAWGSFAVLAELLLLNISNNELTSLPKEGAFRGMTSLQELDASHNKINFDSNDVVAAPWPLKLFSDLYSIEKIDLSYNRLQTLPQVGIFVSKEQKFLKNLDLSNNNFLQITSDSFLANPPATLTQVSLANNRISSIDTGEIHAENLRELDLSNNNLRTLPPELLRKCAQLRRLRLSYNPLEHIPGENFANLSRLTLLDLRSTNLHELPWQILAALHTSLLQIIDGKVEFLLDGTQLDCSAPACSMLLLQRFLRQTGNTKLAPPASAFVCRTGSPEFAIKHILNLTESDLALPATVTANQNSYSFLNDKQETEFFTTTSTTPSMPEESDNTTTASTTPAAISFVTTTTTTTTTTTKSSKINFVKSSYTKNDALFFTKSSQNPETLAGLPTKCPMNDYQKHPERFSQLYPDLLVNLRQQQNSPTASPAVWTLSWRPFNAHVDVMHINVTIFETFDEQELPPARPARIVLQRQFGYAQVGGDKNTSTIINDGGEILLGPLEGNRLVCVTAIDSYGFARYTFPAQCVSVGGAFARDEPDSGILSNYYSSSNLLLSTMLLLLISAID